MCLGPSRGMLERWNWISSDLYDEGCVHCSLIKYLETCIYAGRRKPGVRKVLGSNSSVNHFSALCSPLYRLVILIGDERVPCFSEACETGV